ncbi:hypothetical protein EC991_008019 [Linnemannia zychae]|nr:hypothetical protein EC991_008019 [Linnemannia zychae]
MYSKPERLVQMNIILLLLLAFFLLSGLYTHSDRIVSKRDEIFSKGRKPRYIFIDLGANGGDSLEVFLQNDDSKFKYSFPKPEWATYEQADIYLFEANPVFNNHLVAAKQKYADKDININIFPSTVVDIRDGTRTFFIDTVNVDHDFWGSSIYTTHPDVIKSSSKGTELTAINFAGWLLRNALPNDFVVVKMDIEGAEYEVVPHLAEMGAWAVMDHLLVEWHGSAIAGGTAEEINARKKVVEAAAAKLQAKGVQMPHYNSAA